MYADGVVPVFDMVWIVFLQVLCGHVPYRDLTDIAAMLNILEGRRPQKPEAAESLDFTDELWRMVERCWRENRDERPEVREVLRCLESAAQAWDVRPPPPH